MAMSRRFKRELEKRKPRIPQIGLDFGRDVVISGMTENEDGSMTFFDEDGSPLAVPFGSAALVHEREGRKGPKVTIQVPSSGTQVGVVDYALSDFGRVFGVDTNTNVVGDTQICITTVCELVGRTYEPPEWKATTVWRWSFEFRDKTRDAERIGWHTALTNGQGWNWFTGPLTALLLVDAHLGEHHDINARRAPVVDHFMLPEGVLLGYASADRADHMGNKLLAHCDGINKQVLDLIRGGKANPLHYGNSPLFAASRYFRPSESP